MTPSFVIGHEDELRRLIARIDHHALDQAACRGLDPEVYHPDSGPPEPIALQRCVGCVARLACLGLALRAEDPEERQGWYGGVSPEERAVIALEIAVSCEPQVGTSDCMAEARRLYEAGWVINDIAVELGRCRRTVQRWLRLVA